MEELIKWSGRLDLNQRPSAPKADALPDCATPRTGRPVGDIEPIAPAGKRRGVPSAGLLFQVRAVLVARAEIAADLVA